MKSFWEQLEKPFFVLAPMADVTDAAFRRIIGKYGKPPVMWTEFVSADGLFLADERGRGILMKDLIFSEAERPIVAQFFTSKPELMEKAASLALECGFDGVDINMGCPDRSIERQGAGATLIKSPVLAQELIAAAKQGARSHDKGLPVSVKTRIGYSKAETETWIPVLLKAEPAAIAIHARTRTEMSKVPAHWDQVARAVEIRNEMGSAALIIGNGGLGSLSDARGKADATGADGMMLGKAIFGNPWLFADATHVRVDVEEKLRVLVEHTKLFEELLPHKNFAIMKKHYKAYVAGLFLPADGVSAKELRSKLMAAQNAVEVEKVVEEFLALSER